MNTESTKWWLDDLTDICVQFQLDLSCLVDGELEEVAAGRAIAHLEECAVCREFFDDTRSQVRAHRELAEPEALLERYVAIHGETQCRYGCTSCADQCPEGVPISDVLRTRMYDVDYGEPAQARREYAAFGTDGAPCLGCSAEPCAGACPHGLDIRALTLDAHRRLA